MIYGCVYVIYGRLYVVIYVLATTEETTQVTAKKQKLNEPSSSKTGSSKIRNKGKVYWN